MSSLTTEERFWAKVDRSGDCWEWTASVGTHGYGVFGVGKGTITAHRMSAKLAGRDPSGLVVCHTCDNKTCVNPEHLWVGTQRDNLLDMRHKGRQARGRALPQTKLTAEAVLAIREEYSRGIYQRDLAKKYGIAQSQISQIVNRKSWAHI